MKEQILKNYLIMASVVLIISSCFALTSINTDTTTNSTGSKDIFENKVERAIKFLNIQYLQE